MGKEFREECGERGFDHWKAGADDAGVGFDGCPDC